MNHSYTKSFNKFLKIIHKNVSFWFKYVRKTYFILNTGTIYEVQTIYLYGWIFLHLLQEVKLLPFMGYRKNVRLGEISLRSWESLCSLLMVMPWQRLLACRLVNRVKHRLIRLEKKNLNITLTKWWLTVNIERRKQNKKKKNRGTLPLCKKTVSLYT